MSSSQSSGAASAPRATPVRIKFWGVRGSIPTPGPTTLEYGGNTSCIEVRAGDQIVILDAGTGLRLLGRELLAEFGDKPLNLTLLLTHTHWDHIQGLPFFLPVYQPNNQLRILGYEGARQGLESVLSNQMESPFFPIGLKEVPANIRIEELKEWEFELGGVRVQACYAFHPGVCVGYRLDVAGRSIAFFPDNELLHDSNLPSTATKKWLRTPADRVNGERKLLDFVRGVDVLVMDSQYDAEEYERHIGWGHGCVDRVVAFAVEARAKRLYLFHHDPNHDDAKISEMAAHARKLAVARSDTLQVDAAREGLTLELPV